MFQDKMVTTATPERVYELCKLIEKEPLSTDKLREKMEPEYLQNKTSYFSAYRNAAEELKLISITDNTISLAVDPLVVKNMSSMRRYVNSIIAEFENGPFYKVTQQYFSMGTEILKTNKSVSELAPTMSRRLDTPIDAQGMLGWRFWASFLGVGYLQNTFLIPNAKNFLWDAIQNAGLEQNQSYSFSEFVDRIYGSCEIIFGTNRSKRELNYGVSNGLRALHNAGQIKLEHIHDQADNWTLYPMKAHSIQDTVTNITVCK